VAVLPDVLAEGLDVVFCGTAAGKRSAEVRAYYAGRGNKFWPTLHEVGLTSHCFAPDQYPQVLTFRIGLTDLAKQASGADSKLKRSDFSGQSLRDSIEKYRPRIVAFTSKRAAKEFLGRAVDYGLNKSKVNETLLFTLTSPSGLATRYWQKGKHWRELARLIRELPPNKSLERTREG
jgi:TDG/mug DNA glycosylase family protein